MAVGAGQQPASMRAALRSGAQDFLDVNDSLETAQQALSAMLNRRVVPPAGMALAPVTALVSARAGMGCSVLAAHLAWYLQMQLARAQSPAGAAADGSEVGASSLRAGAMSGDDERALEALLIEVSQPGGDCAIYLNTPGEFRFADALHQRQRMDRRMAQIALARHASGLRMLTQTHASLAGKGAQSAQDEQAVSGQCADLLQRLRTYFRHLLLDMGACDAQRPQSIDMLLAARDIWVVCDQSVASVVWTMELLQQFDACSIPRDRMRLIVGRHDARIDLSAEQLAQQLRLPLLAVIPERRRELAQQLNQGELLHPRQTREPFVQAVSRLASGLLAGHHPELVQDSASSASAWARLLARMTRH
ncbi:hypothetical protein SDC9_128170 [bioreactor metagenome]|uniref:Response regulatory domain-containing protein n=1 Tax=bioreactor metagenome TaxID=1076179 RepID=A0A645CW93_9ZZZZ